MLIKILIFPFLPVLHAIRVLASRSPRLFLFMHIAPLQPLLVVLGRMRAYAAWVRASAECPAYAAFLKTEGCPPIRGPWDFHKVPVTEKANYVKAYSIEARCYGGKIPKRGVVIDESSGSSGAPNNWVRGPREREDVKRVLQLSYDLVFPGQACLLLNCFALGPWATGMNVSMSLVDVGILKSLGPDMLKLDNTLELFGPRYRYLIFAYPPFIKSWMDSTSVDLSSLDMNLVVGGEGISEAMRTHFMTRFRKVISSYGASDLEINLGIETDFSIALRRRCEEDAGLSTALFGRDKPPMIFQYNPLDYVVETTSGSELVFSIARYDSAAPKLRYNLHDHGGAMPMRELEKILAGRGISAASLAAQRSHLPILYVFGRSDLTVPFYGAKVGPADLEAVISSSDELVKAVSSFKLKSIEDEGMNRSLKIFLEKAPGAREFPEAGRLHSLVFDGLCRVNQDFREVTRMFKPEQVQVEVFENASGPFAQKDIRVKSNYIG